MNADTVERLRQRLAVLDPVALTIEDESHLHAGHAGARDGGHYKIHIVAAAFAGKNTLGRHRIVYDAVGDLMRGKIHALSINAAAPGEV